VQITLPQYLLIINAAAVLFMFLDKFFARKNLRRIPESVLLSSAMLGGSLGVLLAMQFFRHKTNKPKFRILIPLFLILHIILLSIVIFP